MGPVKGGGTQVPEKTTCGQGKAKVTTLGCSLVCLGFPWCSNISLLLRQPPYEGGRSCNILASLSVTLPALTALTWLLWLPLTRQAVLADKKAFY